ncbi:mannosyltransferase [Lacinutrix sp. Bg11-31]|uniref:mannosyltransferase n=1 Tax=Lacinutrix sp. Bg11-31 TaxID=2057808 RepID=UPI000C307C66|nr:mannosyltransferase [Lacinutrix sp. Bg11-31]AUC82509.1 mannosyltransferase [Lacinutrix sp. Bg11-31]
MFNSILFKTKKLPLLLVLISAVLYSVFAYNLERTAHLKLIVLYAAVFFIFYKLVQQNKHNFKFLALTAFIFRAIFILAIPNLSQDFYRFIWDGRIILEGLNPYLYTPELFITNNQFPVSQAEELYTGMGTLNGSHYTNYPPINQLCFIIAGVFANKSIVGAAMVLRLLIIAADFGTLYFGKKLLEKLNLPVHNIFWFILNPFIIIELTGNLHFEGVMIFFLVWSLYLLHCNKWKWAAVVFALSITTKLVPLMFLPLFFWWFSKRNTATNQTELLLNNTENKKRIPAFAGMTRLISFYSIIILTTLLLFAPFFSTQFIDNYSKTVGLWFGNFEFNASIYYIAREIGYWFRGYNEIAIIGKALPVITVLYILFLSFFRKKTDTKKLIIAMLFSFTIYLFLSTTVHPWYIATILILSVFTNYKFPLVWSFIVIISYLAYANADNTENLWIIGLEYLVVFSVFIWEVFITKKRLPKGSL